MDKEIIGFIGGGNMGSALIGGLIKAGYPSDALWAGVPTKERARTLADTWQIHTTQDNNALVREASVVVLAVKPQVLPDVLISLDTSLLNNTLFVSVAAGITTSQIQHWLKANVPLVRAMPNTPALIGAGVTGLFATSEVNQEQKALVQALFDSVGQSVWLDDESWMDTVTALSGSGPAYFFYFMEALIKSAEAKGLPPEIARELTLETALGSAKLARAKHTSLKALRESVTSPKGTTEAGINALKDGKLEDVIDHALSGAQQRARALSEAFDP